MLIIVHTINEDDSDRRKQFRVLHLEKCFWEGLFER